MVGANNKIGLVYLNRKAEGSYPVNRFIESYKTLEVGVSHDFIVIYKGYKADEIEVAKCLFKGIDHRHIVVDDQMTDIDTYLIAAEYFSDIETFCFLNTFSEIRCENWLLSLMNALSGDNVGIAGATASNESLLNSSQLISKVIWLCKSSYLKYDKQLHLQYKTILEKQLPRWLLWRYFAQAISIFKETRPDYAYTRIYDAEFEKYWRLLCAKGGTYEFLNGYPAFPNPHIRSNGFIIKRSLLLSFFKNFRRMSKNESYLFESGAQSLTRQILDSKMRAVVVNKFGNVFDFAEWSHSQTFRLDNQQGLIVQDNQTRNYQQMNSAEKDIITCMTWGDSTESISGQVFTFGIPFDNNLLFN
jgi:hypothetical protein